MSRTVVAAGSYTACTVPERAPRSSSHPPAAHWPGGSSGVRCAARPPGPANAPTPPSTARPPQPSAHSQDRQPTSHSKPQNRRRATQEARAARRSRAGGRVGNFPATGHEAPPVLVTDRRLPSDLLSRAPGRHHDDRRHADNEGALSAGQRWVGGWVGNFLAPDTQRLSVSSPTVGPHRDFGPGASGRPWDGQRWCCLEGARSVPVTAGCTSPLRTGRTTSTPGTHADRR
jgi:hypothetical protein